MTAQILTPAHPSRFAGSKLTLLGAVRSEAFKLRTVTGSWVLMVITLLLLVGMGAAYASVLNLSVGEVASAGPMMIESSGGPLEGIENEIYSSGSMGMMFGAMLVAALGVTFIASEYSTRAINTALTAVPRRTSFYLSKFLVITIATFVLGFMSSALAYSAGYLLLSSSIKELVPFLDPVLLTAWASVGAFCVIMAWMGLGFGALLRNTAGGIVLVVAIFFILPIVLQLFTLVNESIAEFMPYLPMNLGSLFTTLGAGKDGGMSQGEAGAWLTLWGLGPALLGWVRLAFTDSTS